MEEAQVIALVRAGEVDAFTDIVEHYQSAIIRYLFRMTVDYETAKDLAQDTFIQAYKGILKTNANLSFKAWLYRIAHNTCYSKLRKDAGKTFVEVAPEMRAAANPVESRLAVEKALQHLPEDQREAVVLKVFHNLKFDEIAAILSHTL